MLKYKHFILEQYLSWRGHYEQYFRNLLSDDYNYIYCSEKEECFPNSIFLRAQFKVSNTGNFLKFIRGRFQDSFSAYTKLVAQNPYSAHLIEFEPFSFLYLLIFKRKKIPRLIITIHSVDRMHYTSLSKNLISLLQRIVYRYTLRKAASMGSVFVTHYKHHRDQLTSVIGNKTTNQIIVINYPCPSPQVINHVVKGESPPRLLIYGQIREDKGIYEFLIQAETKKLRITIAGQILDSRILDFKYSNLTIINKFLPVNELKIIVESHDFMLLPYDKEYTGGAGTLKDSLSFGLPVIASNIPIFKEVITEGHVGFIFNNVEEIAPYLDKLTDTDYLKLSNNCLEYSNKYNWNYMRREYFSLYADFINNQKKYPVLN